MKINVWLALKSNAWSVLMISCSVSAEKLMLGQCWKAMRVRIDSLTLEVTIWPFPMKWWNVIATEGSKQPESNQCNCCQKASSLIASSARRNARAQHLSDATCMLPWLGEVILPRESEQGLKWKQKKNKRVRAGKAFGNSPVEKFKLGGHLRGLNKIIHACLGGQNFPLCRLKLVLLRVRTFDANVATKTCPNPNPNPNH